MCVYYIYIHNKLDVINRDYHLTALILLIVLELRINLSTSSVVSYEWCSSVCTHGALFTSVRINAD